MPSSSPPTAALFDIGNVLVHLDFAGALTPLIPPETEDPAGRIHSLLEKQNEMESGAITADEFIPWAVQRLGFTGSREEFRAAWNSIFEPIHIMWGIAAFLKSRQLRLILFSNTNALHADWLLANYEVFEDFDGQVFSHEVGALKPDPAIYHHAIEEFALDPEQTLYLDDLPDNIATGRKLGFRCHQYHSARHHEFVSWLDHQFGVT